MNGMKVSQLIAPAFIPVHRDLKRGGHAEYWLKGGRGSTKSSFIATEIILGLLKDPDACAIVYRKVAATLRESVYEELSRVIHRMNLAPWFQFRISPLEIRYRPTGQRILFRGADDPAKSKSIALSKGYFRYLWFEELAEFSSMDDVRTIQASVIRGAGSEKAVTLFSYNPPVSASAWVNEEALTTHPRRMAHESTYLDVPREWLGDAFIAQAEALRSVNERAYRHMYLGEVTGTGGQVFDNLELRPIEDEEISTFGRFYNGLDFGFAVDPDAFTRWAYSRKTRALYAISEFYGAHTSLDTLAERVLALAGRELVQCDCEDGRTISELKRRGVNAVGVKKGPGSVRHGMRWLQDLGKIVVDPRRTPNIAREFSKYEYAQDRNGNFLADYPDKDNHTIDSCRYACFYEINRRQATTRSDIY